MIFTLDPRLESDSRFIADFPLCQVRLSNNAAFTWIILVPRQSGKREIIDLSLNDQTILLGEIRAVSMAMQTLFRPKKLNIANLGNIVEQLHIHIIARYAEDKAWPGPVWNSGVTDQYNEEDATIIIKQLQQKLELI